MNPENWVTLLDLAKMKDANGATVGILESCLDQCPEINSIYGNVIPGKDLEISYWDHVEGGDFRHLNEGVAKKKSQMSTDSFSTYLFDCQLRIDKAAVKQAPSRGMTEAELLAMLSRGATLGSLQRLGRQMYDGKPSATDKGFPGLKFQMPTDMKMNADEGIDQNGTVGGSAATDPAWRSSIYLVYEGMDGVQFTFGNGENAFSGLSSEWRTQSVDDGTGKCFDALMNSMCGYIGFAAPRKSASAIHNITKDSGISEQMIAEMILAHPSAMMPTKILMSRRVAFEYRKSITSAYGTAAGKQSFCPLPSDIEGAEIVVTDCIPNDEEFIQI